MVPNLLLHCLEKLCVVRCSQCLMIVHSVGICSHDKGKWILQLLLYFIVLDLPNAVPCLSDECNVMAKTFWWSDDPSSSSCGAWLSTWFSTGQDTAVIQASCSAGRGHLALVWGTFVGVCLSSFVIRVGSSHCFQCFVTPDILHIRLCMLSGVSHAPRFSLG